MFRNTLIPCAYRAVVLLAACVTLWGVPDSRASAETVLLITGYYSDASNILTMDFAMPNTGIGGDIYFKTYGNGGGITLPGFFIAQGGGIDSVLNLYDSSLALRGTNDDYNYPTTGRDSFLHTSGVPPIGTSTSIPPLFSGGEYRIVQNVFGAALNDGDFALNVVSPIQGYTIQNVSASAGVGIDVFSFGQVTGTFPIQTAELVFDSPFDTLTADTMILFGNHEVTLTAGTMFVSDLFHGLGALSGGENGVSVINLGGGNLTSTLEIWGGDKYSNVVINHTAGNHTSGTMSFGHVAANFTNATYNLSGTGVVSADALYVGGNRSGSAEFRQWGGTAEFGQIELDAALAGYTHRYRLSGGILTVDAITLRDRSVFELDGGTLVLTNNTSSLVAALEGEAQFNWLSGTLRAANFTLDNSVGQLLGPTLTLTPSRTLEVLGTTTIDPGLTLTLDGGTLTTGTMVVNGNFVFDSGVLTITQPGASISTPIVTGNPSTINIDANNVSLGSAIIFTGFNHQGELNVGANTVTLNSAGYAKLGVLTALAGGTINAPNGVTFGSGSNLQGHGSVNARVTGEAGSVIEADNALTLGDATSPAGFNFGGELRTNLYGVTLNSSAAAGLGNLTTLGVGGTFAGNLNATNGFVVDFDEVVNGYGTINSTNTLAKQTTINGRVQGISPTRPITLSGYIKGVGTFDNTVFTGTYSPGLSPTSVSAGNLSLSSSSTLIMEIGGLTPGSNYDRIEASGALALGGTLDIDLISGFNPQLGNSFDLVNWGSISGTFATLQLPVLASYAWDTSSLYTSGVLGIVSGLPGDYNNSGGVDAADYVAWRKNNNTAMTLPNDSTPGTDQSDYAVWRAHFGQAIGSGTSLAGTSASDAIPEPASALLLILGAIVGSCRNRRITSQVPSTR